MTERAPLADTRAVALTVGWLVLLLAGLAALTFKFSDLLRTPGCGTALTRRQETAGLAAKSVKKVATIATFLPHLAVAPLE